MSDTPKRQDARWTMRARRTEDRSRQLDGAAAPSAARPTGSAHRPGQESPVAERTPSPERKTEAKAPAPRGPGGASSPAPAAATRGTARQKPTDRARTPWKPRPRSTAGAEDGLREARGTFVDDPAQAVEQADALAEKVTDALVNALAERRAELRSAWHAEEPDTEALRLALLEYQSYVEGLIDLTK